ncbi:signal recognition particle-docking protein FtsY [Corynebacterium felinum]|uniref:Signal recognition particle receptor FtsY n=1 Tax=Corynebacterium felinum TaxID=131318 RepID=A0ABU2BBM7_9CORY|nr:signal recognition particle-docking protein FtsY [Corynebacterium felinum]MDF5819817.1 signal recognition particle-docking protein FtsY [Corynebacterium felinum]MDR7356042.1 fused signal recognition particle receptor [Corynebacterium felinum]WJY95377.1 Signal recognition particle receptor FtsY [Corynebacterium felinum]
MLNTTILFVALVVLILIVALVVIGLARKKSKTVSFEQKKADETKELTQQEKSGNYQAQGGFAFAPAKKVEEPVELKTPTPPVAPVVQPAVEPKPQPEEAAAPAVQEDVAEETVEEASVEPAKPAEAIEPAAEIVEESVDDEVAQEEAVEGGVEVVSDEKIEENFGKLDEFHEIVAEETEEPAHTTGQADSDVVADAPSAVVETPAPVVEEQPDIVDAPVEEDVVVAPVSAEEKVRQAREDIDPAAGRIGRLRGRLARSQNIFGQSVLGMLSAGDLDEDAWEDIEAQLIQADLGVAITMKVVEQLREKIAARGVSSEDEARMMLRECLIDACKPELDRSIKAMPYEGKPAVVLMVGVNGTGKTTTTGKLARVLVSMGHKVLLGAADTFRAAAADQLEAWGRRVGAEVVRGPEAADPASVAFDAVAQGVDNGADVVVIDTAGRLHNSANLMDQLGKVKRVVEKKAAVDEVLLVLDATTGQNGLNQAKVFGEVVNITGVVLTKLDGTAKGGIVFQVQEDLGVPVKLVGLGEGADDLAPFEVEGFVDALLG